MSLSSGGSLSSITTCMPYFSVSSITPSRTSSENGSFSTAIATVTSDGSLPAASACSAASLMASRR